MTHIGFLACETTLPSSGERRGDAFEHDLEVAAIEPAMQAAGLNMQIVDWRAPIETFHNIALVLLGTAWDYQDHAEEFLAKLEALQNAGVIVCNAPDLVRWNMTKTYLRELAEKGAATIPTLWLDNPGATDIAHAFAEFGCDKLVVKRQIGAGALDQVMFSKTDLPETGWNMGHKAMIQPFLPQIQTEGEISFIFIDGQLSHTLLKRAAAGDYRIQSLYGGYETEIEPDAADCAAAANILSLLPDPAPLYARIDMVRGESGSLLLMEAELIEPYLYPEQGPQLGALLAQAVTKRIAEK